MQQSCKSLEQPEERPLRVPLPSVERLVVPFRVTLSFFRGIDRFDECFFCAFSNLKKRKKTCPTRHARPHFGTRRWTRRVFRPVPTASSARLSRERVLSTEFGRIDLGPNELRRSLVVYLAHLGRSNQLEVCLSLFSHTPYRHIVMSYPNDADPNQFKCGGVLSG